MDIIGIIVLGDETMNLANKITIVRLLLVPIYMLFASNAIFIGSKPNSIYVAIAIFLIASITDKLDGYIARRYKQITKLGIFLDPLADKLLVTAALICLVQSHKVAVWIAFIIIGRELVITFFRLSAVGKGIVLPADKTGKIKMVIQVIAIIVAMFSFSINLISTLRIDILLMYIAVVITVYSGVGYLIKNRNVFSEVEHQVL